MIKQKPSINDLKQFAITLSWAMPLFFVVIIPWIFNYSWHWWPFAISIVLLLLLITSAKTLIYPYKLWMFIGGILGWINTRIILGITFYLLILPMGLVLKLFGKLQYKNRPDKTQQSYYQVREKELIKEDLEKPF